MFVEQLVQSLSLKHPTVLTSQQPLRVLGKRVCRHPNGDITVSLERSYYYSKLKRPRRQQQYDIDTIFAATSSTTRFTTGSRPTSHLPQRRWNAHLGISSTSGLQFTAKVHTRHLAAPTEWDWTHLKHTLTCIKGTLHYKFLISSRLPQGHSLPL